MDGSAPASVTQLLNEWKRGDAAASAELMSLLYAELKRVAASQLRRERADHTLEPTALVHEAWIRLNDVQSEWKNRAQFFAMAAMAMRRILVDHARRRATDKRGGGGQPVDLDDVFERLAAPMPDERLLQVDAALTRLAALDARQARVVELRYFAGLSIEETAAALELSSGTVKREWVAARTWLFDAITRSGPE